MNVLVLSPGADTAGQGIRIKEAFDRCAPDWNVRAVSQATTYLRYPTDAPWEDAQQLYAWADVVHHKSSLRGWRSLDKGDGKPAIIHHQGSDLRDMPERQNRETATVGAVPLVSTVDLLEQCPEAEWLPAPYNLVDMQRHRKRRGYPTLNIVHAPTNREIKGTDDVIAAFSRLSQRYDIELRLIEQARWLTCLSHKGTADIFVDQLKLGYGCNAVEAWAMGIPVVARSSNPVTHALMRAQWGPEMPFCDPGDDLEGCLAQLIESAELRQEYADRGMAHFMRYHEESVVVEQLKRIWTAAPPSIPSITSEPPRQAVA